PTRRAIFGGADERRHARRELLRAKHRRGRLALPSPLRAFAREDAAPEKRAQQPDLRALAELVALVEEDRLDERGRRDPDAPPAGHWNEVLLVRRARHHFDRIAHERRDEREPRERLRGRRDARRQESGAIHSDYRAETGGASRFPTGNPFAR